MGRCLRFIEARLLPRGWLDLIRQILLFVGALVLYDFVRGLVSDGNPYRPFGDAMRIIREEPPDLVLLDISNLLIIGEFVRFHCVTIFHHY